MTTADAEDPGLDALDALAAEPLDGADLALLAALRSFYTEHDPVPDGLVGRIEFELTLDALQTEAAVLTQLDLVSSGSRSGHEQARTITFTSDSLTTMVTLTPQQPGTVRVDGWAAPGAGARVELVLADGPRETTADEDGRFVFDAVPSGLATFALHLPGDGGITVVSPAVEL